jgi:HSP20 family protein
VERVYGTFLRTIQLPFAVKPDQIQASFQNGVLTIVVPKSAAESQAHRVQIARSGSSDRSRSTASSGIDRAAAGDKPSSAAGTAGAGGTAQAQSSEGGSAESAESGKKKA